MLLSNHINDPAAIYERGWDFYTDGVYNTAFEYWTKAAAIGDVAARYQLSVMYERALGVEEDEKKQLEHLKAAAVAWNTYARYYLGCIEWRQNEKERAIKHWIIGSKLGHDKSLKEVKDCYEHDEVSKEDFATTLRAHQAAVDATKSPQREEAEARQNSS